jgi:predicted Zn-dependent peptidase
VTTREPDQLGERRVTVKKFAQLQSSWWDITFRQPRNSDYYPLQVLKTVLFEGQSSRMYQRLVDKDQLALSNPAIIPPRLIRPFSTSLFDRKPASHRGYRKGRLRRIRPRQIESRGG